MVPDPSQVTEGLLDRAGRGDDLARRELLDRYRDQLRRMVAAAARSSRGTADRRVGCRSGSAGRRGRPAG